MFNPRLHLKSHPIENLYILGGKLTGIMPTDMVSFINIWSKIKALDILNKVKVEDIGTYIIEFPEFQYLNDFQKRALNALVQVKNSIKKGIYNEETKRGLFQEIINDEAENERKVNELIVDSEGEVRAEKVVGQLDEADLAGLRRRLDELRKGGKKSKKYKHKTKGKKKNKTKLKINRKIKNKTRRW
jgi:hypothetical protein